MSGIRSTSPLTLKIASARVQAMNSPAAKRELSKALAAESQRLVLDGFKKQKDPYGKPWAPLSAATRKRKGSSKALIDTGNLRGSIVAVPLDSGFRVETTVDYAAVHQYGSRGRRRFTGRGRRSISIGRGTPRRQMIPMAETGGIPEPWTKRFNNITRALIKKTLGGEKT
jgi:phage virion morphogenesis protein